MAGGAATTRSRAATASTSPVRTACGVYADLALGMATGEGKDTLLHIEGAQGGAGNDMLVGDGTGNLLDGGGGNDKLSGAGGDDTLIGGDGNDLLNGGAGLDQTVFNLSDGVFVDLSSGVAHADGNDTLVGIEGLQGGGDGNDTLIGDGNANFLLGKGGDNSLGGRWRRRYDRTEMIEFDTAAFTTTANVAVALVAGTATGEGNKYHWSEIEAVHTDGGDDTLTGDDNANLLDSSAGDDQVAGAGGDDTLIGGAGDDAFDGGDGFDLAEFQTSSAVYANLALGIASGEGND